MQTDPELSDEIRRFEEQYAQNPDSLVFARLADLHRKAGRPERALEILDEGLERHPDYLSAHIVRARCLRALDRRQESEEVFGHVLELDGENLVALRSLAEMAWERGDGETARQWLRELLDLDPSNEEARDLLEEIREGPEQGPGEGEPPRAGGTGAAGGEAFAREGDDVAGEAGLGSEDEFGWEDDFAAEDDPFAGGGEAGATADDAFGAEDDPFARAAGGEAGSDAFAAGGREPADRERRDDEDLIIEPTSRRETADDREPTDDRERSDDREPEPGEAGEPERAPADATGDRAFDVEAVETAPEAGEPGSDPREEAGGEATGEPAPEGAEVEGSGRWWDFLGSGGEDEMSETRPEAGGEAVAPEPAPDDGPGSPAVGPASEAEELRAQIEELRMQAEQETDLSDAEEDLATETLANLYEAQGFYREAVEMYEELAEQRPDDEDLRRRLERARNALEATEEASARGADEAVGPADAEERPTDRASTVSAAEELRSVLRGDASPEGHGTAGP